MKINNIISVLRTCIILLSSFATYFFCILCHLESFRTQFNKVELLQLTLSVETNSDIISNLMNAAIFIRWVCKLNKFKGVLVY